jgi:hypothetical protein
MGEASPIDHKDEAGVYRAQVRAAVFGRLGGTGQPVTSQEQLVGSWDVVVVGPAGPLPGPTFVYRLGGDGNSVVEVVGQSGTLSAGEWRLNPDATFSLLTWCPPEPEFGIDDPQLDEDRRYVAALADGRVVMWNGDGSLVLLLAPQREWPVAKPRAEVR